MRGGPTALALLLCCEGLAACGGADRIAFELPPGLSWDVGYLLVVDRLGVPTRAPIRFEPGRSEEGPKAPDLADDETEALIVGLSFARLAEGAGLEWYDPSGPEPELLLRGQSDWSVSAGREKIDIPVAETLDGIEILGPLSLVDEPTHEVDEITPNLGLSVPIGCSFPGPALAPIASLADAPEDCLRTIDALVILDEDAVLLVGHARRSCIAIVERSAPLDPARALLLPESITLISMAAFPPSGERTRVWAVGEIAMPSGEPDVGVALEILVDERGGLTTSTVSVSGPRAEKLPELASIAIDRDGLAMVVGEVGFLARGFQDQGLAEIPLEISSGAAFTGAAPDLRRIVATQDPTHPFLVGANDGSLLIIDAERRAFERFDETPVRDHRFGGLTTLQTPLGLELWAGTTSAELFMREPSRDWVRVPAVELEAPLAACSASGKPTIGEWEGANAIDELAGDSRSGRLFALLRDCPVVLGLSRWSRRTEILCPAAVAAAPPPEGGFDALVNEVRPDGRRRLVAAGGRAIYETWLP